MEIKTISERFDLVAKKYDEQRRFFIPCFDDFYQTSISLLSTIKKDFNSVLDLGAGTGLLTRYLYDKFPNANYTLVDVAEQMMSIAQERFSGLNRFKYVISDYSSEIPVGNFDLIASALSIHHLENEAKISLFKQIFNKLPDNGFFINLDQFNATSEFMNNHYVDWWHSFIKRNLPNDNEDKQWLKRRELDRENTIPESIQILKHTGFKHVECIYSFMKFGVIIAIK